MRSDVSLGLVPRVLTGTEDEARRNLYKYMPPIRALHSDLLLVVATRFLKIVLPNVYLNVEMQKWEME